MLLREVHDLLNHIGCFAAAETELFLSQDVSFCDDKKVQLVLTLIRVKKNNMSWTQQDAFSFIRPLSNRELLTQFVGSPRRHQGLEDYFIHAAAVLKDFPAMTPDLTERFRGAWQQLRFDHPGTAMELDETGRNAVYKRCESNEARSQWLRESFCVDTDARCTNDIYGSISAKKTSFLCVAPGARAVVLFVQHWHGDGRGVLYLLGRMLSLVFTQGAAKRPVSWGDEVKRLPLASDVLAGLDANAPGQDPTLVKQFAESILMMGSEKGMHLQGDWKAEPRSSQLQKVVIPKTTTGAIVDACKREGISVSSAFHAACCLENIRLGEGVDSGRPFAAHVRRDFRKFLPEPQCHLEGSADTTNVSTTFARVDRKLSFLELAHCLHEHNLHGFSEERFRRYDAAHTQMVVDMMLAAMAAGATPPGPTTEMLFSSIGKLDELMPSSTLGIKDVELGTATYTPALAGVWLYTFDGCINLTVEWNDAYRTDQAMLAFVQSMEDTVTRELKVPAM